MYHFASWWKFGLSRSMAQVAACNNLTSCSLFANVINCPHVAKLRSIFAKHGFPLRLAGGPVRDLLMKIQPIDLDFATTATPAQMKEIFAEEKIRVINALGEKHGTITARIDDVVNYEITTLRIDKVTDGRRAEVVFTDSWQLDACRRDLTMNAMYLDLDSGEVIDFVGGQADLMARRIRFVGSAGCRIQEDYLRILRYFRFHDRIEAGCTDACPHDPETLSSIKQFASGLNLVSGQRIWMEWKKILNLSWTSPSTKDAHGPGTESTIIMITLGLGPYIGLDGPLDLDEFRRISSVARNCTLKAITHLAALLHDVDQVWVLHNRLHLSAVERDLAIFIVSERRRFAQIVDVDDQFRHLRSLVVNFDPNRRSGMWRQCLELCHYAGRHELARRFAAYECPVLPLKGSDVLSNEYFSQSVGDSPKMGKRYIQHILQRCREKWLASDCTLGREAMLDVLSDVIKDVRDESHAKRKRKSTSPVA